MIFLLVPIASACDAKIISGTYQPNPVYSGNPVTMKLEVRFDASFGEQCNFVVEGAIVPLYYYSSIFPLSVIEPIQCCPGNTNYGAEKFVMDTCWNPIGCSETREITVMPFAPTPQSYDHCADCTTNPERCQPGFYWTGPGDYIASASVWNGCCRELAQQGIQCKRYDFKSNIITVKTQDHQIVCGNGICEPTESIFTCPVDCLPAFWQRYQGYIIISISVVAIIIIAYFGFRRRK